MNEGLVESLILEQVQALVADSWRLTPRTSMILSYIATKIGGCGLASLTPAESIWVASLVAERQIRASIGFGFR